MNAKEQILKMIEEEIAKYDKTASQASGNNDTAVETRAMAKSLALGQLRKRINEEVK